MIIPIKLNSNSTALLGVEKILLPESVFLDFSSVVYPIDSLVVTVRRGTLEKSYKPRGKAIDITEFCTHAGLVEIVASLTVNCEVVKTWRIEPLILREAGHTFEAIPEIEAVKEEIDLIKRAIADLVNVYKNSEIL